MEYILVVSKNFKVSSIIYIYYFYYFFRYFFSICCLFLTLTLFRANLPGKVSLCGQRNHTPSGYGFPLPAKGLKSFKPKGLERVIKKGLICGQVDLLFKQVGNKDGCTTIFILYDFVVVAELFYGQIAPIW
jgi:hypothetical protein